MNEESSFFLKKTTKYQTTRRQCQGTPTLLDDIQDICSKYGEM